VSSCSIYATTPSRGLGVITARVLRPTLSRRILDDVARRVLQLRRETSRVWTTHTCIHASYVYLEQIPIFQTVALTLNGGLRK